MKGRSDCQSHGFHDHPVNHLSRRSRGQLKQDTQRRRVVWSDEFEVVPFLSSGTAVAGSPV